MGISNITEEPAMVGAAVAPAMQHQGAETKQVPPVSRQYLPGLDGFRAIAASVVLIGHVYQIAGILGYDKSGKVYDYFTFSMKSMVNLFFVISGFIITYVLYNEKVKTGTVSLLHFYKKRLLRIWPLYFFLLLAVLLISKYTPVYQNFNSLDAASVGLIALFLVNLEGIIPMRLSVLPHYWSLSVEEQFYLFWPASFRKFNGIYVCLTVLIALFLLRNGFAYLSSHSQQPLFATINQVLVNTCFGSMAIGGLAGIGFKREWAFLAYAKKGWLWYALWLLVIIWLSGSFYVPYINSELQALLFATLILGAIYRGQTFLDKKPMSVTGKISYGIYMYHWPVIPIIIYLLKAGGHEGFLTIGFGIPMVLLSFGLTYAIAYLSYTWMELPVMRLSFKRKARLAAPAVAP